MHVTPPAPFSQSAQYKKNLDDGDSGDEKGEDADGGPQLSPLPIFPV